MARKNPTVSKIGPPRIDGIELPIIAGQQQDTLRKAEEMPEVNMTPNNGDNPSVSDAAFADGHDCRSYGSSPKSDPTPAMPGA